MTTSGARLRRAVASAATALPGRAWSAGERAPALRAEGVPRGHRRPPTPRAVRADVRSSGSRHERTRLPRSCQFEAPETRRWRRHGLVRRGGALDRHRGTPSHAAAGARSRCTPARPGQRGRRARHGPSQPRSLVSSSASRTAVTRAGALLAGKLDGRWGEYPVFSTTGRAQDVPGAIVRAYHEAARTAAGGRDRPDGRLEAQAPEPHEIIGPELLIAAGRRPAPSPPRRPARRRAPAAIVGGAGADGIDGWAALITLAERLSCPVFRSRSAARRASRRTIHCSRPPPGRPQAPQRHARAYDTCSSSHRRAPPVPLRARPADPQRHAARGRHQRPEEAHAARSSSAVLGDPPPPAAPSPRRSSSARERPRRASISGAGAGHPLYPGHVLHALAERLPRDAILLEETPSSRRSSTPASPPRPERLHQRDGNARLSRPGGDRRAARTTGPACSRWSATARASTRSRTLWSAQATRPACSSSCSATAATRS